MHRLFLLSSLTLDVLIILAVHLYYGVQGRVTWSPHQNPPCSIKILAWSACNILLLTTLLEVFFFNNQSLVWTESWIDSIQLLVFGLFYTDIFSWCIHRCMHHPLLFRHIHAWHHLFHAPYAWVTFYCHPLENLLFNLGNVIGPLWIYQPSHILGKIWTMAALVNAVRSHSIEAEHAEHHRLMKVGYGTSVFMDRLFGTCA